MIDVLLSFKNQFILNKYQFYLNILFYNTPRILAVFSLNIKVDDLVWDPRTLEISRLISNLLKHSGSRQSETICLPFLFPMLPVPPLFHPFPDQQALHNQVNF